MYGLRYLPVIISILLSAATSTALPVIGGDTDFLTVTRSGATGISVTFSAPEAELKTVDITGQPFRQLDIASNAMTGSPDGPVLPAWSRWIKVPDGMKPVLQIRASEPEIIRDIDIAPFPASASDNPDMALLNGWRRHSCLRSDSQDKLTPEEPASVSDPITVCGRRWAVVTLTPYRCNPARRELHITGQIDLDITFEPDVYSQPRQLEHIPPVMRELERLLEGEPPSRDNLSQRIDNLGHYVIITPDDDDYIEALEPFVEWKTRKGFVVTVADLDETGDRNTEIREWLIEAYEEWEIPPTFVLLVSDCNNQDRDLQIPVWHDGQGPWESWHGSDQQYVRWIGEAIGPRPEDWITDGFIGRLPAANARELEGMVAKIIGYEVQPFDDDPWIEGALLIANGVRSCEHANWGVRELMEGYGYNHRDIHEAYADWQQGRPDLNFMINSINDGVGFINFRGYNNWGDLYQHHISQLRNDWKLPIVTGMVCGTNDFLQSFPENNMGCRGEVFLRSWDGNDAIGAVACFGPTDLYTWTWFNNTMDGHFYHALFVDELSYLGALCNASKLGLITTYPSFLRMGNGQSTVGYYFYTYNLLGDPGMVVRTREPVSIEADIPPSLPVGATYVNIFVFDEDDDPVPGAYVHIYLDEEVRFGATTDSEGWVQIETEPLLEGEYKVTVSGQNLIPVLSEFEVVQEETYLSVEGYTIDDDDEDGSSGNNDGSINPGETIELSLTLRNTGSERCDGATVVMSSESEWVEFSRDEVEYDALDEGEAGEGDRPFILELAPETPDSEMIDIELTIFCDDLDWDTFFRLTVVGYNMAVSDHLFLDGYLYPGEEQQLLISVNNEGELDAAALNAMLFCADPRLMIRQAESTYEPIPAGETVDNNEPYFEVFAGPLAYMGSEVSFGLLLTDEDGLRDSLIFTTILGEQTVDCPQGPDGYGYWAFDNRDTSSGMAPEFDWIPGQQRINGLYDPNDQGYSSNHGSKVYVDLPFEFRYYGREYDGITIGSNGWLCFGHSDQISWNNQEMGSPLAPAAMVAPFWKDLWDGSVYTDYDEDEAYFIVEWRNFNCQHGGATFEVILYDPSVHPSATGDGEIVFQYDNLPDLQVRRDTPYEQATIGICSHNRKDKLQITHASIWDPRTEGLESEMAVRFSTGPYTELGGMEGNVIDSTDGSPMEGVRVMMYETGFFDRTDEDGYFRIEGIPVGNYTVVAFKRHFNEGVAADFQIVEDEVREVNFSLTHPTFDINIDNILYGRHPGDSGSVEFDVWNDGNGPLDYEIVINYEGERDEPWDMMFNYNLSAVECTGNDDLKGMTFDGEYLYVCGADRDRELPNDIYVVDKNGEYVREMDQYQVGEGTLYGYTEMAWNGENLLCLDQHLIIELTRDGEFVDSIPNPVISASAIAWAPERGTIFTAAISGRYTIMEIDTAGEEVNSYSVRDLQPRTYGLAWFPVDPDGFNLYIFVENRDEDLGPPLELLKLNTETGEIRHVNYIDIDPSDKPGGCIITKMWDPLRWTFIGFVTNPSDDYVFGVELMPNLTWVSIDPASASIPSGERRTVTVTFFTEDMPERAYNVVFQLYHNAFGDRYDIPVHYVIDPDWDYGVDEEGALPLEFSFEPPRPNPFNPTTLLVFSLPHASPVELTVYDISGRLVQSLDFGSVPAGTHTVTFDGSRLPSGIYIAQLKSGVWIGVRKMVLVR